MRIREAEAERSKTRVQKIGNRSIEENRETHWSLPVGQEVQIEKSDKSR